jgi:hypothetical protein
MPWLCVVKRGSRPTVTLRVALTEQTPWLPEPTKGVFSAKEPTRTFNYRADNRTPMPSDAADSDAAERSPETDGGPGFDQEALYRAVQAAVEDAILGAIGTILLVGVGTVIGFAGLSFLLRTVGEGGLSVLPLAAGVWLLAIGVYIVASTLGVVQPVRDWF